MKFLPLHTLPGRDILLLNYFRGNLLRGRFYTGTPAAATGWSRTTGFIQCQPVQSLMSTVYLSYANLITIRKKITLNSVELHCNKFTCTRINSINLGNIFSGPLLYYQAITVLHLTPPFTSDSEQLLCVAA